MSEISDRLAAEIKQASELLKASDDADLPVLKQTLAMQAQGHATLALVYATIVTRSEP
jgi:hypothetical protein